MAGPFVKREYSFTRVSWSRCFFVRGHNPGIAVDHPPGKMLPVMKFQDEDDIIFVIHQACLEIARLVAKRHDQPNIQAFIRSFVHQRRKDLIVDSVCETNFGGDEKFALHGIRWDNFYYGVQGFWDEDGVGPKVCSLPVVDHSCNCHCLYG